MDVPKNISETVKETYDYYKGGKSIEQIAKLRDLKETTIYGHFETLILNELVSLDEIVDQIKKEKILGVLKEKNLESLREIKDQLDESINYGEIRCVLAFVKLQKNDNSTELVNYKIKKKRKIFRKLRENLNSLQIKDNSLSVSESNINDNSQILTVKELTRYIKNLLESDSKLSYFFVKGEVSNLRKPSSGHLYFSLKDEETQIRCVFFKGANKNLKFELEDGMKLIVRGEIDVYQARGEYNIIVEEVHPDGLGALHLAFTQLKKKLEKEGLFSIEHKKQIPKFPKTIAVVTSPSGAVLQDILNVISKRYPLVKLMLFPTVVQGKESASQIIESIDLVNNFSSIDVMILGRGGGSLEDLWSFNEELVARAIYESKIPIISAVGHETDFTIADFVADKRAPTPSAAAEIAVPDIESLNEQIEHLNRRSAKSLYHKLRLYKSNLEQIRSNFIFKKPLNIIHKNYRELDQTTSRLNNTVMDIFENRRKELREVESKIISSSPEKILRAYKFDLYQNKYKLQNSVEKIIDSRKKKIEIIESKIITLNPKSILKRGYSIVMNKNRILINSSDVKKGEDINIILHGGKINAKVKKTWKN